MSLGESFAHVRGEDNRKITGNFPLNQSIRIMSGIRNPGPSNAVLIAVRDDLTVFPSRGSVCMAVASEVPIGLCEADQARNSELIIPTGQGTAPTFGELADSY